MKMTRLLIINLLAFAMLLMPLHGYRTLAGCPCAAEALAEQIADQEPQAQSCCGLLVTQGEDDAPVRPAPCDGEECPSSCCARAVTAAFVLPQVVLAPQDAPLPQLLSISVGDKRSPPHLRQLKRPPRLV